MGLAKEKCGAIVEIYNNRSIQEADIVLPDGTRLERAEVVKKKMGNKADYISNSRIDSYSSCPRMFYQTFIEQTLDGSSVFTYRGTFMHRILELYVNQFLHGEELDLEYCIVQAMQEDENLEYGDYSEVSQMVRDWLEVYPLDKWDFVPLHTEAEFVMDFGEAHVSGIIDLLGVSKSNPKQLVIVDYKSNFLPFSPEDLENSLQLQLYSAVCKELFPEYESIKCQYFMIQCKKIQITPQYSDEQLEFCKQYIQTMDRRIKDDSEFKPKLNTYCCYRECRHTCPLYQKAIETGTKVEFGDEQKLIDKRTYYYNLEKNASSARKEIDRTLKEYIKDNGAFIDDAGFQWSCTPIKKIVYDYKKLEKVLLAHNRLDLLNGFCEIRDPECFTLMVNKLDDLFLKLDILGCQKTAYRAEAVSKKKVVK